MNIGDSISVNGVCLTVTSFSNTSFTVDIIRGTRSITLFSTMKVGTKVNLERALLPTTRLGGHFVSGHIDTSVVVKRIQQNSNTYIIELDCPQQYRQNVIPKGSIAVNGISLTIFELSDTITLNIILKLFVVRCLTHLKLATKCILNLICSANIYLIK